MRHCLSYLAFLGLLVVQRTQNVHRGPRGEGEGKEALKCKSV